MVGGTGVADPGLRVARSAAVVSVVSDAATRCVSRFVLAAAAARVRWDEAADARAARADFVASPRVDAALEEAARDAAVRFEPVVSTGSAAASACTESAGSVGAAADVARFVVVGLVVERPAAGAFGVVASASGVVVASVAGAVEAVVFAAFVRDAAGFDAADLDAADFAADGLDAALDAAAFAADDFAALFFAVDALRAVVLGVSPDDSGRELVPRAGAPSVEAARDAAVLDDVPRSAEERP